jgi:hypothetical protein
MPADNTWEDGLIHVVHGAYHCVGPCRCTLVVWSTCCTGVVVVHIAAMCEAVVPVLETFYSQGGEAAWGLMSTVPAAISAAVSAAVAATIATATANVATAICVAVAAAAVVAATANNVIAIMATAATATIATAVVATALLTVAVSTPWASWLLLRGLTGVNCLAEHLKLPLHCQDIGGV